jgi:SAM-dependent methyltransferase
MLCAAATDPYTQCGMTRLVCLSRLDDFTLPHLSNRYARTRGVTHETLRRLVEAVEEVGDDGGWQGPLVGPENRLPSGGWWKDLYEPPRTEVLDLVPGDVDVLVVGCGWGATEGALVERGQRVTALPIDPVVGRLAADRGVEVVRAGLDEASTALGGRRFGCVVLPDLLHLVAEPAAVVRRFLPHLDHGGSLVVSVPNVRWPSLARRLRRTGPVTRGFECSGVHATSRSSVARWLRGTGLAPVEVAALPGRRRLPQPFASLAAPVVAGGFVVRAELSAP